MLQDLFSGLGWALAFALFVLYVEQRGQLRAFWRNPEKPVAKEEKPEDWKKKAQAMPKPRAVSQAPLKLVASGGKRLYEADIIRPDFGKKSKKGPKNSGPDDVA